MSDPGPQPLVGISVSDSPDLERLGFGREHLDEMMVAIARTVLRMEDDRTGLVYGGDLRAGGFTRLLFDIALSERGARSADERDPPRRIYNYLPWPRYLDLARGDEAQLINACHFMRVTPSDAGFDAIPADRGPAEQTEPRAALVASRCLTRMRELSTDGGHSSAGHKPAPPLRARILLGGKTSGYSSFMPGLFEEFLIARETTKTRPQPMPVFLIGAFGGAAEQLARALIHPRQPEPLTLPYQLERAPAANAGGLAALVEDYARHPDLPRPEARYEALRKAIDALAGGLAGGGAGPLDNGLDAGDNRRLLTSRDLAEILRLLKKGLDALIGKASPRR
jgi:hypothetical protein